MPGRDAAKVIHLTAKNRLASIIPADGLEMTVEAWDAIEKHKSYKSNFDRRAEGWVFVKNFDGDGSKEFRATSRHGWHRVTAGISIDEAPSRELLSWLHFLGLVKCEVVDRVGPLITRQITAEERKACLGAGRGRPLEYPCPEEHATQVAALKGRVMKRRDAK